MKVRVVALSACLAISFTAWAAAPAVGHQKSSKQSSAANDKSSDDRQPKRKKSSKKNGSNCPPDWMRKTNSSGVQIGTGQPDGVLPIGCYESLAPPPGLWLPPD